MIKSKFGFLGWNAFIGTAFFFVTILIVTIDTISKFFFSYEIIHQVDKGKNHGLLLALVLIGFFAILSTVLTTLRFTKIILVDINDHTITFVNLLTKNKRTYSTKDIDGYYDATKRTSHGYSYKMLLLMKDNKVIERISQYYYSNYNELLDSISDLNYLGTIQYGLHDSVKMLLNQEI